jgi:hypothetical protein
VIDVANAPGIRNFVPDTEVILGIFRNNPEMCLNTKKEIAPTPSWELEFSEKIMSAYVLQSR